MSPIIFARRWIEFYADPITLWVRVFGYGFVFVNRVRQPLLFSARCGSRKVHHIGIYTLEWLKPRS